LYNQIRIMNDTPSEAEIQKVIKLLKKTHPDQSSRENAIETIEGMKKLASLIVDQIEKDVESGSLKVNDKGEIIVDGKVVKKVTKKENKSKRKHL
jgi:UDP-N-acetylglucosamine enolpyruvyl transferase